MKHIYPAAISAAVLIVAIAGFGKLGALTATTPASVYEGSVTGAEVLIPYEDEAEDDEGDNSGKGNASDEDDETVSSNAGTYTLAQVAVHNSRTSCWTSINGTVYDVTTWINQHPGGVAAILSLCGTDGSDEFNAQHGGERRPASELASFAIGKLSS